MEIKIKIPANLKQAWNENPIAVIGVSALAVTAASKLIDSLSGVQSRRAYAKKMDSSSKSK